MKLLKKSIRAGFWALGFDLRRRPTSLRFPIEFSEIEQKAFDHIRLHGLSMVSDERLFATILACKHVIEQNIPGDFVECGVYKGGNAILAKMMFDAYGVDRKVWLFDTFLGMTKPQTIDVETSSGEPAIVKYQNMDRGDHNEWVFCPLDQVKANFSEAGLLDDNVIFVQGDVLQTLDSPELPQAIAVLRLDTDWYESTKKELEVLYPLVTPGGALLIDDYGHFRGSQKATDEYFAGITQRPLLNYTDYSGRLGIKPGAPR